MNCYSKWNSAENKRKRSERSSRAAQTRWDTYHAALKDEPLMFTLPGDCYEITVRNLIHGKVDVFLFHPARKSGSWRIDRNGESWLTTSMTNALSEIRKLCKRFPIH